MKIIKDKVAVITGAASGIGRSLAVHLAREGCHLAICDVDPKGLKDSAAMIKDSHRNIFEGIVDVADRSQVYDFAEKVMAEFGRVDVVINNAGAALRGSLEEISYEEFEWLMGVNFWGVVYGSKAFLPYLKRQPEANLVNISSVHGFFTNPGVGAYSSSKFGVRGFTMVLRQELRDTSVNVSCVYPGGIKTNIVLNAREAVDGEHEDTRKEAHDAFTKIIARTGADKAAKKIIQGIKKDTPRILIGSDARVFDVMTRLFPVYWQKFMGVFPDFVSKFIAENSK